MLKKYDKGISQNSHHYLKSKIPHIISNELFNYFYI